MIEDSIHSEKYPLDPNIEKQMRSLVQIINRSSSDDLKEKEIIDLDPENYFPNSVSFPEQHIDMMFLEFQENEGIYYAGEVRVKSSRTKKTLIFKKKAMVFNESIPAQIFMFSAKNRD